MTWSTEAVLALAPDAASATAGRGLASPAKWVTRGLSDLAAWGEAKGSGANPYQVIIDFSEPAFRCSCPSRKFPCKHSLGLFLMVSQGQVPQAEMPPYVQEWLEKRRARTTAKAEAAPKTTLDPEAQARRAEKRWERMVQGIEDLSLWLRDTARQGLANPAIARPEHFERMAARLVDAQVPGLARRLREVGDLVGLGSGWQQRAADRLAMVHLLAEGATRLDELDPGTQEDLRQALGLPVKKEDIPAELHVRDHWSVVGQRRTSEDRLMVQRSWLFGETSGRWAMVLAFSVANQPFDPILVPGTAFRGTLAFAPGNQGLRALVVDRADVPYGNPNPVGLDAFADLLARSPWTEVGPLLLESVRVSGPPYAVAGFPFDESAEPWQLLAHTGNYPAHVFGEWDGRAFRPLSAMVEGRFADL